MALRMGRLPLAQRASCAKTLSRASGNSAGRLRRVRQPNDVVPERRQEGHGSGHHIMINRNQHRERFGGFGILMSVLLIIVH
jgi:hypothetical protein